MYPRNVQDEVGVGHDAHAHASHLHYCIYFVVIVSTRYYGLTYNCIIYSSVSFKKSP